MVSCTMVLRVPTDGALSIIGIHARAYLCDLGASHHPYLALVGYGMISFDISGRVENYQSALTRLLNFVHFRNFVHC